MGSFTSYKNQIRRGSGINTERFPKRGPKAQASGGGGGQAPPGTGQMSTWKVFFIIKNIFIMKKLINFRKAVEAGVDPLQQMSESVVRPDWPTVFRPYPRRLERLTICRCHQKRSTFF